MLGFMSILGLVSLDAAWNRKLMKIWSVKNTHENSNWVKNWLSMDVDWIVIDANRGPLGDIKMSLICHLAHGLVDNLMELLTHRSLTLSEAPWVQQAQNIMMTWVSLEAWLNIYKLVILIQIVGVSVWVSLQWRGVLDLDKWRLS